MSQHAIVQQKERILNGLTAASFFTFFILLLKKAWEKMLVGNGKALLEGGGLGLLMALRTYLLVFMILLDFGKAYYLWRQVSQHPKQSSLLKRALLATMNAIVAAAAIVLILVVGGACAALAPFIFAGLLATNALFNAYEIYTLYRKPTKNTENNREAIARQLFFAALNCVMAFALIGGVVMGFQMFIACGAVSCAISASYFFYQAYHMPVSDAESDKFSADDSLVDNVPCESQSARSNILHGLGTKPSPVSNQLAMVAAPCSATLDAKRSERPQLRRFTTCW